MEKQFLIGSRFLHHLQNLNQSEDLLEEDLKDLPEEVNVVLEEDLKDLREEVNVVLEEDHRKGVKAVREEVVKSIR